MARSAVQPGRRPGEFPHEIVWSALGGAALLAARLLPLDRMPLLACPLRAISGIPCPSCGGTRAFLALAHLDLAGALRMNPLAALLGAALALYVAHSLGVWLLGWRPLRPGVASGRRAAVLRGAVLALLAANWIYLVAAGR